MIKFPPRGDVTKFSRLDAMLFFFFFFFLRITDAPDSRETPVSIPYRCVIGNKPTVIIVFPPKWLHLLSLRNAENVRRPAWAIDFCPSYAAVYEEKKGVQPVSFCVFICTWGERLRSVIRCWRRNRAQNMPNSIVTGLCAHIYRSLSFPLTLTWSVFLRQ